MSNTRLSRSQAETLEDLNASRPVKVIAVTGGKGGVGKTTVSANLAVSIAAQGRDVMLVDADLGLANVDVVLGLNTRFHLGHVVSGVRRRKLSERDDREDRQRPGECPGSGPAQGVAALLSAARGHAAGGFQGSHPDAQCWHRGGDPRDDRERLEYPDLLKNVIRLAQKYHADTILIEEAGSGISLIQSAKQYGLQSVLGMKPKTDKETRMYTQTAKLESKSLSLPRSASWLA